MTIERIKEIQNKTAYPESVSVQQALLQVWNECKQEPTYIKYQQCPVCQGKGQILADDFTSSVYQQCDVCNGQKIIPMGIKESNHE